MNNTTFLTLGGSAIALTAASFVYFRRNNIDEPKEIEEFEELADDEIITEEDIAKIFDSLFIQIQQVLQQIGMQLTQLERMGHRMPEAQVRQVLISEFERNLVIKQEKVFDDFDVDEACVEEATMEFMSDPEKYPKAKKAVERFQKLWESVSGEKIINNSSSNVGPSKKELTQEELIDASKLYFGSLTKAMHETVQNLRDSGASLEDPAIVERIQMEFISDQEKAEREMEVKMGVSLDSFQSSIEKYKDNQEVAQTIARLQSKQHEELANLGLMTPSPP